MLPSQAGAAKGGAVATADASKAVQVELFGGKASQNPGFINADLIAKEGIVADLTKGLPFKPGSVNEIVASNPYIAKGNQTIMDWLPNAAEALAPGGRLTINATANNLYAKLPSAQTLENLGLRVVQEQGSLLPQFKNQTFYYTDGGKITKPVLSTILEKVR